MTTPNNTPQEWVKNWKGILHEKLFDAQLHPKTIATIVQTLENVMYEKVTLARLEGRQEAIEECKKCVPESKEFVQRENNMMFMLKLGFNECRTQTLSALDKLQDNQSK